MSVKIALLWELGWNTPIKESELWIYPMREFGVEQIYASPISGIHVSQSYIQERQTLEEIIEENKDFTVVWCHEKGEDSLKSFQHPENALYIFGKTNYSPFLNMKEDGHKSLCIETPLNSGLLWGHQAAAIILYDRNSKWQ